MSIEQICMECAGDHGWWLSDGASVCAGECAECGDNKLVATRSDYRVDNEWRTADLETPELSAAEVVIGRIVLGLAAISIGIILAALLSW